MTRFSDFKIGLFVLSGIVIGLGALFWISTSTLFKSTHTYVTFFDTSVQGVSTGSEVKYLGMAVGRISSMKLVTGKQLVEIKMSLNPHFKVKDWMAAQLQFGGITSGKYLGIVKAPDNIQKVTPKIDFSTQYPVIPSVPGQIEKAMSALKNVYSDVQSLDIGDLVTQWEQVAKHANALLAGGALEKAVKNIDAATRRIDKLTGAIADEQSVGKWHQTLSDVTAAAQSARKAASSLENQLAKIPSGQVSDISSQTDKTLKTINQSTRDVQSQISQAMVLLQENMRQLNQTLTEFQDLAQSLRQQPGRILTQPEQEEPFKR